jgi:hypothetical protein
MSMRDYLKGHHRPRGGRGSSNSTTKIVALVAVLVILIGLGITLIVIANKVSVPTDSNTLCRTDKPPSEVVVLLLDMSDEFTEPQRLKIKNEFRRLEESIPRFGLFEAYAVDNLQKVATAVVHLCKPYDSASLEQMNELYQNPQIARKKWDRFVQQLDEELQRLMDTPQSETSPIFEAIQATALRTFDNPDYDGLPKRLIIVSDLLQNTPDYSQYNGIAPFKDFKRSPYYSKVRADLKGVSVEVLYLARPHTPQKWPNHYRFWEDYFVDQGAQISEIKPVWGAQ